MPILWRNQSTRFTSASWNHFGVLQGKCDAIFNGHAQVLKRIEVGDLLLFYGEGEGHGHPNFFFLGTPEIKPPPAAASGMKYPHMRTVACNVPSPMFIDCASDQGLWIQILELCECLRGITWMLTPMHEGKFEG